jgi:hypothetical protein
VLPSCVLTSNGELPRDAGGVVRTAAGVLLAPLVLAAAGLLLASCASSRAHPEPAPAPTPAATPAPTPAPQAQPAAAEQGASKAEEPDPCKLLQMPEDSAIDKSRLVLARTLCSATAWFDGLFGDRHDATTAEAGFGRLELGLTHSQFDGTKLTARLNARYPLPNIEKKLHIFVARENQDDFIQDRMESLALRSQFLRIDTHERWVAGVGYALSESAEQSTSFRLGARINSAPEIFGQGIYRRQVSLSERSRLYLRETVFWTNRDGFGSTTSVGADRILSQKLVGRIDTVGTISEATQGVDWRTSATLYRSLEHLQAIAAQAFVRGETSADVPFQEWGLNAIYRRPLGRRDWLFGELLTGYSWPREHLDQSRKGSLLVGVGVEVAFEF